MQLFLLSLLEMIKSSKNIILQAMRSILVSAGVMNIRKKNKLPNNVDKRYDFK